MDILPFNNPATDIRGLAPRRAELARLVAWRRRDADALAVLEAGRAKLAERIANAEATLARHAAEVEAEASNIVDNIRRGGEIVLNFIKQKREPEIDLTVARAALAKADLAIDVKRGEIGAIAERITPALEASLVEQAQSIADEYAEALRAAAEAAARLAGLEQHFGRGHSARMVLLSPGFSVAGDEIAERPVAISGRAIAACAAAWRAFGAKITVDPRADAARFLRFPANNQTEDEVIVYHDLHPAERRLVDLKRDKVG